MAAGHGERVALRTDAATCTYFLGNCRRRSTGSAACSSRTSRWCPATAQCCAAELADDGRELLAVVKCGLVAVATMPLLRARANWCR
ncbi:MAG: hypothetical protein U1F11_15470 [Steroidobacteraceae bacterium]